MFDNGSVLNSVGGAARKEWTAKSMMVAGLVPVTCYLVR